MQTPLILNSANSLPHNTPVAKQGTDATPATQFNQVLSRQIKDRPTEQENRPQVHGKDNAAPAKPASGPGSKTVAKSSGDKEKTSEAADDSDEKTESASTASTDLIALVAQAAQFSQANAKTENPDASSSEQEKGVVGVGDGTKNSGKQLDATNPLEQLEAAITAENGSQNGSPVNSDKRQNDLLSASAQEALPELAAREKKQEILSELPASAKVQETPSNPAMAAAHQMSLEALQSAGGGRAVEKLSPHVGTPAWDQALGQKIVWMVGGAQQSASLTLNPPDLGPLQVVLNVSNEQANATFIAAQPEVRQAIEAALPKLREMMSEAGIQLGQTNINAGSSSQQQSSGDQSRPSASSFAHEKGSADTPASAASSVGLMTRQGLVNTFA